MPCCPCIMVASYTLLYYAMSVCTVVVCSGKTMNCLLVLFSCWQCREIIVALLRIREKAQNLFGRFGTGGTKKQNEPGGWLMLANVVCERLRENKAGAP